MTARPLGGAPGAGRVPSLIRCRLVSWPLPAPVEALCRAALQARADELHEARLRGEWDRLHQLYGMHVRSLWARHVLTADDCDLSLPAEPVRLARLLARRNGREAARRRRDRIAVVRAGASMVA